MKAIESSSSMHLSRRDAAPVPDMVVILRRALRVVFAVALAGVAFSGALLYRELVNPAVQECTPLAAGGTILGQPPCLYGLLMYSLIALLAGYALARARAREWFVRLD